VLWLQGVTLAWMLVEFCVSVYAAVTAHSPAMLAFGSDSLVELLSASVVILQWIPGMSISERRAGRTAGALLFMLALVVAAIAVASLALRLRPETSRAGIAITIAALIAMPVLASLKRREARRSRNAALAADAVQSATCAYLAFITLAGLAANAAFHIAWFDPMAALVAIPILIKEGRSAWHGHTCGCC
jgi:divalent metal cation (Fe/Co/Zn/Cd) transporter